MRAVALNTLRNKLSEYLRLVARGETVLITDRHRVVAELVPPRAAGTRVLADAMLADAVRQGWVTPPARISGSPPSRKPVMSFQDLMSELTRDRADR